MIERTQDKDGELVDPDLFKIIEPKIFVYATHCREGRSRAEKYLQESLEVYF